MIVRAGFSLIDLLVSIVVMSLLIALLLPGIGRVRESARRVQCMSNLRQDGLAVAQYAADHDDLIPVSVFGGRPNLQQRPDEMMLLHLGEGDPGAWEGMGWLIGGGYTVPETLYCPSHRGQHAMETYESAFDALGDGEIIGNYNWRPLAEAGAFLPRIRADVTLATDGLRTKSDYSHQTGANLLKADSSVTWLNDSEGFVLNLLPDTEDSGVVGGAFGVAAVWGLFDNGGPNFGDPNSPFFRGSVSDQRPQGGETERRRTRATAK